MKYISVVLVASLFTACVTQKSVDITKEIVVKKNSDRVETIVKQAVLEKPYE